MLTRLESRSGWAVVTLAGIAGGAFGQTITDGNSTLNMLDTATTGAANRTGTNASLGSTFVAGGDTTDQLFQQWWWYRVNSVNAREFAFSNRTSNVASGNTLTLTYVEPEGLNATVVYRLTDGADVPASANVSADVTLTNTTAAPLDLAFFSYIDYDLEGAGTDSATLLGPGRIQAVDSTTQFMGQFLGEGVSAYSVGAFATVRSTLTDADVDNFASTGLPFAAADFSAGYQWNLVLPPGGSQTIRTAFSLNMTAMLSSTGPVCDSVDFNADGLFPDTLDVEDFISVLQGGPCSTGTCNDIDFNNDGLFPDTLDLESLLSVFAGGACL